MGGRGVRNGVDRYGGIGPDWRRTMETDFVFLDSDKVPFRIKTWGGEEWLFRWGPDQNWVSMRKVSDAEIRFYRRSKISKERSKLYV
jgi:hypothetical protein